MHRRSVRRWGPVHVVLAVLLGGDAVLLMSHVAHLSGWRAGLAIVVAWAQVALCIAVLVRPVRLVLILSLVLGVLGVGTWLSINTASAIPSWAIGVGAIMAGLVAIVALVALAVPSFGAAWSSTTLVLTSVVPVGIVIIVTAALFAAPAAHSAGSGSGGGGTAASGSGTGALSPAALALKNSVPVPGQNSPQFQQILAGNDTEKAELKPYVPLDAAEQTVLTQQLSDALQAAERFPTVASAKAAGMILAGGMAPGVGAHYQTIGIQDVTALDGQFNPSQPASWIYASTADNAPVVGVMYESLTAQPPSGFIGPNDHWHRHSNVCVKFNAGEIAVPFAADQNVTPQECADVHGIFMKKTVWMVHAWVVPGWESPQGVFSHDNLHVYCPGNTDLVDAIGFCARQQ